MYIVMLALWIIFNGKITLEILFFGIVICTVLYRFTCNALNYDAKKAAKLSKMLPFLLKYYVILLIEIIKANLQVMKIILSPGLEITPKIIRFHTDLQEDGSKLVLANSITLTPGTITAELQHGDYVIHALDEKFAEGIEESTFVKQLREMEGKLHG